MVYASKTLTPTERRYAQIEKETLAILLACRKFEMYILGRPVTIQTDHQPLIKIFQKPLTEASLRIQRMLLALQRYNITLTFKPDARVDEIRLRSKEDPDIQSIIKCIIDGWPQRYDEMPSSIQIYWKYKHELSRQFTSSTIV